MFLSGRPLLSAKGKVSDKFDSSWPLVTGWVGAVGRLLPGSPPTSVLSEIARLEARVQAGKPPVSPHIAQAADRGRGGAGRGLDGREAGPWVADTDRLPPCVGVWGGILTRCAAM